ncbi:unnamed protein product [Lupinus luteus]|uniref:RanBP2-type domain-containing protein n=1 Tax=Lupinus luteus TaxID=3873 RepID=A0AAV1YD03_LUPLU
MNGERERIKSESGMGEGREGDWECSRCNNRNYGFRSFCNRCKQSRLLVDTTTPSHSKWLPRIGDWICSGCTNNNYASREKCKKCGEAKEVAGLAAVAMTYSNYFPNWPLSVWNYSSGWRIGDWICICGFHNYSSRSKCKNCNAFPPALGTKRLASQDLVYDFDKKRLNVGPQRAHTSLEQVVGTSTDPKPGVFPSHPAINSSSAPCLPMPPMFPPQLPIPALLGKGAKQWRSGDWMCANCNNHNYASRLECNREWCLHNPSMLRNVEFIGNIIVAYPSFVEFCFGFLACNVSTESLCSKRTRYICIKT